MSVSLPRDASQKPGLSAYRFEPIVCLRTGQVLGAELLAGKETCPRWSAAQWRSWYHQLPEIRDQLPWDVPLFVNVNTAQVFDQDIVRALRRLDARFVLEWTEHMRAGRHSTPMTVRDAAAAFSAIAAQTGCALAIDDIGAGYDGLGRFFLTQAQFAKIDMHLLHKAVRHPSALRNLNLALRNAGAQVVAEGIETQEQSALCAVCDIPLGQGFLFTDPQNVSPAPGQMQRFLSERATARLRQLQERAAPAV
jgi:EAL domain-containing protein (putative c-di-GMP-specific phosphodiesterase class I)